jgi:hypothetical protein
MSGTVSAVEMIPEFEISFEMVGLNQSAEILFTQNLMDFRFKKGIFTRQNVITGGKVKTEIA